jgi:hypothetical protein
MMTRFRTIGLTLVTAFALSAVVASTAQAVTAPYFTIAGTRLVAGRTHNFDARVLPGEELVLHVPESETTITCFSLQVEKGVLLGSNAGQPGKDDEVDVFSRCTLAGNGNNCKVLEPITTNPLTSEQVEIDRSQEVLGEEFKATTGKVLATIKFEGAECKVPEANVMGEVAGENRFDSEGFGTIELGTARQEATSWLIYFPGTPITSVLLVNTKGEKTSVTLEPLKFAGIPAQLTGAVLTLLTNTKGEPERTTLWSPLP